MLDSSNNIYEQIIANWSIRSQVLVRRGHVSLDIRGVERESSHPNPLAQRSFTHSPNEASRRMRGCLHPRIMNNTCKEDCYG